jgi:hypothetical protein
MNSKIEMKQKKYQEIKERDEFYNWIQNLVYTSEDFINEWENQIFIYSLSLNKNLYFKNYVLMYTKKIHKYLDTQERSIEIKKNIHNKLYTITSEIGMTCRAFNTTINLKCVYKCTTGKYCGMHGNKLTMTKNDIYDICISVPVDILDIVFDYYY